MGHLSTDTRRRISSVRPMPIPTHNPMHTDMGTSRNTFTDPRFLRTQSRARIRGCRRRCVRRLRRVPAVRLAIGIAIGTMDVDGRSVMGSILRGDSRALFRLVCFLHCCPRMFGCLCFCFVLHLHLSIHLVVRHRHHSLPSPISTVNLHLHIHIQYPYPYTYTYSQRIKVHCKEALVFSLFCSFGSLLFSYCILELDSLSCIVIRVRLWQYNC